MAQAIAATLATLATWTCGGTDVRRPAPAADPVADALDRAAETYVRLALALDRLDPGYVDAYFGPPAWRADVAALATDLPSLRARAGALLASLPVEPGAASSAEARGRARHLRRLVEALVTRVEMRAGLRLTFADEALALYDVDVAAIEDDDLAPLHSALARLLPGEGTLTERYERYKQRFVVPPDRLETVLSRAIAACRERTRARLALPEAERVTITRVSGRPWAAYNRYLGEFRSVIEVNTDYPWHIDRAIDLGCHEGYPGHHVYSILRERDLVGGRGWIEFAVQPLYGPQALVAEGTASFGIDVAFPDAERVRFEVDTLFPLAGLDASEAARYYEIHGLVERLGPATVEAARRYVDGSADAAATTSRLERFALMPRPTEMLRFIDQYRSYVVTYVVGKTLVREFVERNGGVARRPDVRWAVFLDLLASPILPSDLR